MSFSIKRYQHFFLGLMGTLVLGGLGLFLFDWYYTPGRVFPGIYWQGQHLGGKSLKEVDLLVSDWNLDADQRVELQWLDQRIYLPPVVKTATGREVVLFALDQESVLDEIISRGRNSWPERWVNIWDTYQVTPQIAVDVDQIKIWLSDNFSQGFKVARNASLGVDEQDHVVVISSVQGEDFDYRWLSQQIKDQLAVVDQVKIVLKKEFFPPLVTDLEVSQLKPALELLVSQKPSLTLKFKEKSWPLTYPEYRPWITTAVKADVLRLALRNKELRDYLTLKNEGLQLLPQEAVFEQSATGQVTSFKPSVRGYKILMDTALNDIQTALFLTDSTEVALVEAEVLPLVNTAASNNLGILEKIGEGVSNFRGSSADRVHNIRVGSTTLNRLLVPPGEVFSLNNALGEVDQENGYRQELVIKGDKTVKEYGGGLCQIGTTVFRGALDTGLPIVARRNHSFRIRYYEPTGTDATIYSPAPDFKFKNDTAQHILLLTRLTPDSKLVYQFWGTKDGRVASQTKPVVTDIVAPPPTKYIWTTDLLPGEEKCTESAVSGAKASFDYKVVYPDGQVAEETFKSVYRPWQEVCFKGKVVVPPYSPF